MNRTMSSLYLSLKLHKTSTLRTLLRRFLQKLAAIANTHSTVKFFIIYFSFCCHMPRTCFYNVFSYYGFVFFRGIGHRFIIQYTLGNWNTTRKFDIGGLVKPWFVNRGFGYSYHGELVCERIKTYVIINLL